MKISGNTMLITGGGSGIGRGLAEAFLQLGNTVIISGRRKPVLDEVVAANPGMIALPLDVEDPAGLRAFVARVGAEHGTLNVLINNAGIMRREDLLTQGPETADAVAMIRTNLLGPIQLTAALLPLLRKQSESAVWNVTSGLAFVPMAVTPTYNATKAAMHSYTQSLRYQLKGTTTQVVELIPPYVQTELMGGNEDPRAMPLQAFISEVMQIVKSQPEVAEICVDRVKPLRFAAEKGAFDAMFKGLNEAMH